jgi:methylmalonyl-CoA mutase N-terminal domain/subunit
MGTGLVLLRGINTTTLTEDSRLKTGTYPITGTYRYKSADGSSRTVFVSAPEEAQEEQLAQRKRLDKERHKADEDRRLAEEKQRKAAEDARWHTWTAADGIHTTEAKFVSSNAGLAYLEKRDGTKIKVASEKLSKKDLDWIRRQGWKTPTK